ncbi:MAG TPA: non-heme iron oxygenase ferredoxin subunit [Acidimicrobiales bacterium]|nr:non-heme iron oxygenase ferredoxin subunit [Acidimicrobiales bacterium]
MTRTRLCALEDIPSGTSRRFDVGRHRLALVRIDHDVYVIGDECSHEDYSLSEGEVFADEREIECWKHGSTFSLETGAPQCLPATRPVPVYVAGIEGGDVWVELS